MVSHFISFSGVSESKLRATTVRTRGSSSRPLISAVPTRRCAASAAARRSCAVGVATTAPAGSGLGVGFWMRHDVEAEAVIKNAGIKNLSACERMVTVIEIVGP